MIPVWRKKVWQAKAAAREGRWDDAQRLLLRESLREFLPAMKLSAELAEKLLERCEKSLECGEWVAALSDFQQASSLDRSADRLSGVRQRIVAEALREVRELVMRGDTLAATQRIKRLERHGLGGDRVQSWRRVTELVEEARTLSERGELAEAEALLRRAERAVPCPDDELVSEIFQRRQSLAGHGERLQRQTAELHAALAAERWTEVLRLAESVLESAPRHAVARRARAAAWRAVGLAATIAHRRARQSTSGPESAFQDDTVRLMTNPGRRLVAWIDSVGGYLICPDDEVVLGQPSPGGPAGVAILGDLSRRHASIRRDGECYILKPIHTTSVDGKRIAGPTLLRDGSVITLGDSVRVRFRRPHALSGSAVLEVESHHKADPAVDAVILMAGNCIFGPGANSHVVCRGWNADLVLFRRGENLLCRAPGGGETEISDGLRLEGEDFSLSIEELSKG